MDNSCPATPLVLTETDSKSPLRIATSSPDSDGMKSPSRDSPDSHCVICLGKLQNKSFTDSCLHQFCFQCLLQWSKVKPECPLCKQPFKSIIHNVRSNNDYDQYNVEVSEPRLVLSDFMNTINFDFIQVDRRFRYRSTMTREYFRELAESIFTRNNMMADDFYQISPMVPVDTGRTHNPRMSSMLHNSVRQRGTTEFRRNIYNRDLWVQDLADISGRYRECTPQFYRDNPAQIHRIVPWLNREVNVLLSDCESHSAYILSRIVSILSQHSIRSREFRELVEPYFGSRTDHFIHELYTFAHSVYDIAGFDQHAVYGPNPHYATEVQEISSSNDDSDIEVLGTVKGRERKAKKTAKERFKILMKGSGKETSQSREGEEPVAGPSGLNSAQSVEPLEICDSDQDDIEILDYVKPEPEVVVLSSGEEEAAVVSDADSVKKECLEVLDGKAEDSIRISSDDDYVLSSERGRTRWRSEKGKCKSNGHGLKGKQKQKYIKSRKGRGNSSGSSTSRSRSSTSTSSTSSSSSSRSRSSSSSSSTSSSSTSTSSSFASRDKKSKRKRTKVTRRKCKRKVSVRSSHRVTEGGPSGSASASSASGGSSSRRRKRCGSGSSDTSARDPSKRRKRVKSCVIVPSSKSCDLSGAFGSGRTSDPSGSGPKSPTSYWSLASGPDTVRHRDHGRDRRGKYHSDRERRRNSAGGDTGKSSSSSVVLSSVHGSSPSFSNDSATC